MNLSLFLSLSLAAWLAGVCAGAALFTLEIRRRRLSLRRAAGWTLLSVFDMGAVAANAAIAAVSLVRLAPIVVMRRALPLNSPLTWTIVACIFTSLFIWGEGRRQIQLQRPRGLVFGEWLIFLGVCWLALQVAFPVPWPMLAKFLFVVPLALGGGVIALVVPPFIKGREEHRILERVAAQGEFIQSEWIPATPECPHPERWQMLDPQSAEVEVLDFLKSLVLLLKPELIVETGTFIGHSAIKMAEALEVNGFGRIITVEYDPAVFQKAKEKIDASGLRKWIECRNASSLETRVDAPIDILYSDSDINIREREVRRFLPQIRANGLVLIHDASSHFKVVRDAALRLEQEGLLSVVLLSSPRGLCLAQKRAGRI